jgi:hypothetical protein
MTEFMITALIIGIVGAFVLQGLRRIPASPPYKGQATWLGKKVPGRFYDEGWGWFAFFPYLVGFIPVQVERITFEVVSEKTRTPDRALSRIPVFLTIRPVPELLIQYIDSGQEAGVKAQLTAKIQERIREWAADTEEGPADWVELNQSHLEAVSVLVKQIAGSSLTAIPEYAQPVPTWIWLRYFAQSRRTKLLKNDEPWAGKDGNWQRVQTVLNQIELKHGLGAIETLKVAVEGRRKDIEALRTGSGKIVLHDLGVRLERLNLGNIDVLGKVGEQAEQEAKEEQERQAETRELTHVSERLQALMEVQRPDGTRLTREQALELVQLSTGKATKTIDAKTLGFDPTAAALIAGILGRKL